MFRVLVFAFLFCAPLRSETIHADLKARWDEIPAHEGPGHCAHAVVNAADAVFRRATLEAERWVRWHIAGRWGMTPTGVYRLGDVHPQSENFTIEGVKLGTDGKIAAVLVQFVTFARSLTGGTYWYDAWFRYPVFSSGELASLALDPLGRRVLLPQFTYQIATVLLLGAPDGSWGLGGLSLTEQPNATTIRNWTETRRYAERELAELRARPPVPFAEESALVARIAEADAKIREEWIRPWSSRGENTTPEPGDVLPRLFIPRP